MEYRSGIGTPYWYEWMIGLTKCLDMLIDANIKSVILQSYDYQSLDDVVINYMDDTSVNVQVKHTDTYADENFTYGTLTSGETPMLKSWAIEWQKNKDKAQIKEIRIVTNKKWGPNKHSGRCSFKTFVEKVFPEIKKEYSYCGNDESEKNAIEWFKKTISFLGDDARYFVSTLSFEQSGDSQAIEEQLENQLKIIMGTGNTEAITLAKNALFAQLRIWATSRREEQEITKEGVYRVLCADSRIIPEYELYPQKPIFPSRIKFAKSFCKILKESDKRVILLEGLPGAGKTNFVSCLSQLDDIPIDFRFYTYIPVNKRYPSYSDDEGYYSGEIFWHSLLTQLKKGFEKAGKLSDIKFPIIYSYMSVREMRETALKYLPIYADLLGRTCYLFVDGLDHASRSVNVRNSFLYQLPEPEEISGNVKIILVSQPINEHFPLWFSNNSEIEYISLPVLEESDVEILLQIERINIPDIDIQSLSHSIIKVAGNNALNILFAIQELHTADSTWDFDSIIKRLEERNLNAQISKYYEWIINALQNEPLLPKIELIFAFASRKIPLNHISFMCGVSNDDIAIALDKLFPLIMHENEEYYVFHNDVRLYLKRVIISSRGYLAIALNVRDRIISEEALGCYAYDIIFGSLFEVKSDNYILDIFTSKYITDSLKYDIPLNKLVSQFAMVAQKIGEHKNLDALNNLSQVATTINQYIYCVQYYEKENDYYENKYVKSKTKSEKYILDSRKDSKQIIGDIYFLLINGQLDRGKELFIEYLCSFELLDFLSLAFEDTPSDIVGIHEQSGFVCRYFNDHILAQECDTSSKAYLMFVSGWLKASSAFISNSDLNQTFSFKSYYSDALVSYIETICKKDEISSEIFNLLDYHLLSADTAPILALIELCIKEIFNHHDASQLINVIIQRYHEIEMPGILDGMKFTSEKIPIFIKMVFCIYPYLTDVSHLHDIYEKLLRENRISASDRGYKPARKQFSCALTVFENYYRQKNNTNELIDVIYSLEYLSNKYGIGSCHDCESFRVRHFLLSVICKSYDLENNLKKTSEFCSVLTNIFVCEEPRYISELIPLFVVAGEKSLFLEIAEFWAGANGLMWKNEFNDVEFYFNSFSNALNDFNLLELKNKIELRKKYRIISYTGHKDYALKTLLDWYTHLPLNTKKLAIYGMQLLSISDYANKIGDNRMQHEITKEIFRTAVDLGVQFADALFELKNNPKDYYYWRECLLDTYLEKVSESYFCNEDLFSLYQIVNAWIKVEIEETVQRGYNKTKHLQYYNSTIYSLIDCQKYKDLIKSNGNYIYVPSESSANITSKGDYAWLLELIKEQGYNDEIKSRIRSTYSDSYYGKVEFLISVGSTLEQSSIPIFVRDCVVDYILMESTYGMVDMGLDRLIDKYYKYFSDNDWQNFLINAISKVSLNGERVFYYTSNDLEILSLYYSLTKSMEEYEKAFIERLKLHWSFITAGALLNYSVYSLTPDPNISSIKDFKLKHIGQ